MIEWHPLARRDFNEARKWYWSKSGETGLRFVDDLEAAIERVIAHADTFAVIGRGCREVFLESFPYRVIYFIRPCGTVRIIAVAHFRRRPLFWSRRIKGN